MIPLVVLSGGCTFLFFYPDSKVHRSPEGLGVGYEFVRFPSGDGTPLTGLFFPSARLPAHATVVHFHGNAENMTSHFMFSYWLAREGFNVFVFDYRGYGSSSGRPSQEGLVEDGVAALRYVRRRPEVDPSRILVFGQSLGGAVAVASLAELGSSGIRAIALESVFSSYRSVARAKLGRPLFLRFLWRPLAFVLISDRYRPLDYLQSLPHCPLLVIHGDRDPVVPYEEGLALFQAAREPKTLWTLKGGGHTQAFSAYGKVYRPRLVEFYLKALEASHPFQ